ncbi:MAG: DegT/DnrJ/EryC1/StrS family aminotransferase [Anaerolineae bacterium]|nr:DegT/DnrJ/EryC1/StrS family aminotransferase [Anaerolineae bacterium]
MGIIKKLTKIGYRQAKNIAKLALDKPLTTPSLGSMTLDQDDVKIAREWLKHPQDWYRHDDIIRTYHSHFAIWNGSKYAFSFMGARVALSACIYALALQPGDEVILPGYTCVVVPNAFHYASIKTIYSDIELDTYGLDVTQLEDKITPKTKAILLHHLYGLVSRDYEAIVSLAREHNLKIIEDCAQSTGAEFKGQKVGNRGDLAIYSSEQSKIFNTVQGGLATTNDNDLAIRLKEYYYHASYPEEMRIDKQLHTLMLNYYRFKHPQRWWRGDFADLQYGGKQLVSTTKEEEQGIKPAHYGCKMPAPIAAIGLNQLKKIDRYNECRREIAKQWDHWCYTSGYNQPVVSAQATPVFLRYPVLVEPEKKLNLSWALQELEVNLGVWFVANLHPVKKDQTVTACSNANAAVRQCVNFPCLI